MSEMLKPSIEIVKAFLLEALRDCPVPDDFKKQFRKNECPSLAAYAAADDTFYEKVRKLARDGVHI